MARPLRISFPGAFYHITSRGNEQRKIFLSRSDYEKFLSYVEDSLVRYGVILHCYTLMGNHYHLLLETPLANLSAFMHSVNASYTTYFNLKRERSGHLLQGRFKSLLIDQDAYLLELSRYIHLNPVRAGIVETPEEYPYSSYRAYLSLEEESIATRDLIWSMISSQEERAPEDYRQFVESALGEEPKNPFEKVYGGIILGSPAFTKRVLKQVKGRHLTADTSFRKAFAAATPDAEEILQPLAEYFHVPWERLLSSSPYRSITVLLLKKYTPLSNREIATLLGDISYSAVTKIATRLKREMGVNRKLRGMVEKTEEMLSHVKG